MGFFEDRKKELGLSGSSTNTTSTSGDSSFFDKRRAELNKPKETPKDTPKETPKVTKNTEPKKPAKKDKSFVEELTSFTKDVFSPKTAKGAIKEIAKTPELAKKANQRFGQSLRQSVGTSIVEDYQPGTDFKKLKPKTSTGIKKLDQTTDQLAFATSLAAPIPGSEAMTFTANAQKIGSALKKGKIPTTAIKKPVLALPSRQLEARQALQSKPLALPSKQQQIIDRVAKQDVKTDEAIKPFGETPKALPQTGTVAWTKEGKPVLGLNEGAITEKASKNLSKTGNKTVTRIASGTDTEWSKLKDKDKTFNIMFKVGDNKPSFQQVNGKTVSINPEIDTFYYYNPLTKEHHVHELSTGLSLSNKAKSKKEAIEKAKFAIEKLGIDKVKNEVVKFQNRTGVSPSVISNIVEDAPQSTSIINAKDYIPPKQAMQIEGKLNPVVQMEQPRNAPYSTVDAQNQPFDYSPLEQTPTREPLIPQNMAGMREAIPQPQTRVELRGSTVTPSQTTEGRGIGIISNAQKPGPYDNLKTSTKSQLTTSTKRQKTSGLSTAKNAYRQVVDDLYALKDFDSIAQSVVGDIKMKDRTYEQALASRGSDVIANQILTERMVDSQGNVIAGSMKDALSKIPKGKFVDFEDYLINKHAITRFGRGEKVFADELNWTPAEGERIIAEYEAKYPQFKEAADQYYKFYEDFNQNWLVDSGLLPQEVIDNWKVENPFYVSNQREFSDLEKLGKSIRAKTGFANQSAPVKRYAPTGSQRKIISPIESAIRHVDASVKAAKRNKVFQNMYEIALKDPEALKDLVEVMPLNQEMRGRALTEFNQNMQEFGVDGAIAKLNGEWESLFKKSSKQNLDADNILKGMVNGEPVHLRIKSPELLEALTAFNSPGAQHIILQLLGKATRGVKRVTTGANPFFSVMVNLPRDVVSAYKNSKTTNNPIRYAYDLVDGFVSAIGDKELYQQFKNMGGGHSSAAAADRNLLNQSKRAVLGNKGLGDKIASGFSKLENFTNALEAAPRLGEFKRLTKDAADYESKVKALFEANDVTVNFSRRGKVAPGLENVVLYWNAAVQGIDKEMRSYLDKPVVATAKAVAAVTVPAMILYLKNHDDPDYQQLSDNVKDNFFLIPKGDGKFTKIPVPQGLGTTFKALPERLLRQFNEEDPEAFRNFATTVINNFIPPVASDVAKDVKDGDLTLSTSAGQSTIFGPILDLKANRNFYGGTIVPGYMQDLSPENQFDSRTSEPAKILSKVPQKALGLFGDSAEQFGKKFNQSPKKLDYLLKAYSGGIGQFGLPMVTEGTSFTDALTRKATVDPAFSNDAMDKLYEAVQETLTKRADAKSGDGSTLNAEDYAKYKSLQDAATYIGDIRSNMRAVEKNKDLTKEQRKQKVEELQAAMVRVAQRAYNTYKGYDKPSQ